MKRLLLSILLMVPLLGGCMFGARIKGGTITHTSPTGAVTHQVQGQDPKSPTTMNQSSERTEHLLVPANSFVTIGTNTIKLSSNADYSITIKDSINSVQGSAQKNVLGETIAKLASLQWITYLGALLFIFGVASGVWPPLKALVGGSLTTSAAIAGGGLLLIILPTVVVGHELLILGLVLGGVALWFLAHRHGSIGGELQSLKNIFVTPTPTNTVNVPTVQTSSSGSLNTGKSFQVGND
jgi:hypothetical protein